MGRRKEIFGNTQEESGKRRNFLKQNYTQRVFNFQTIRNKWVGFRLLQKALWRKLQSLVLKGGGGNRDGRLSVGFDLSFANVDEKGEINGWTLQI